MTGKEDKVYRILTSIIVIAFCCHLLLAAFVIFNPNKSYITNLRSEKAYRLFGVTGPFPTADW